MEMNINVEADWLGVATSSDRGAGPLGFGGALPKNGSAATGLAILDDELGGGPSVPLLPASWNVDRDGEAKERR